MAEENSVSSPSEQPGGMVPDMSTDLVHNDDNMTVSGDVGYDLRKMHEYSLQDDADNEASEEGGDEDGRSRNDEASEGISEPDDTDDGLESATDTDDDQDDRIDEKSVDDREGGEDSDFVSAFDGDKEVKLSEDTTFEVKINGKTEEVTLAEMMKTASAGIHYQRELSQLGRQKKKFESERDSFYEDSRRVSANAEAILSADDPYDVAVLIGELKGQNPDEVFNQMVNNTVEAIKRWQGMTERERQLERENRKYRREALKREAEQKVHTRTKEAEAKRANLTSELEDAGFTFDDFQNTIAELKEAVDAGDEIGFGLDEAENITEDDIITYMIERDIWNRLESSLNKVNSKLLDDDEFVERARRAVYKVESLHGKMSEADFEVFINGAVEAEKKATVESLSRKAQKRPNSKRATSHEQDEENESFASIEEYMDSMRGR